MEDSAHIPMQPQEKWTEIEHLPEWDEEFYHVYTAKKFGKWLMLKTLRPGWKGSWIKISRMCLGLAGA